MIVNIKQVKRSDSRPKITDLKPPRQLDNTLDRSATDILDKFKDRRQRQLSRDGHSPAGSTDDTTLLVESVTSQNNAFQSSQTSETRALSNYDSLCEEILQSQPNLIQLLKHRQFLISECLEAKREGLPEFLLKFINLTDLATSVGIVETLYLVQKGTN